MSPYSASAWEKILACGEAVEAALARRGVLLTMGGEPTFVPLQPDGAEWSTAALGPTKLGYARALARQLVLDAFPGAAVLETSGKQYPGEPLPRWALLIQRRADGETLWRDITRLRADTAAGSHVTKNAADVLTRLAQRLGVSAAGLLPCHEAAPPGAVAGYVLPLDHDGAGWRSDDWRPALKAESARLFPGDSLLGWRLPLGELAEENLRRALTAEIRDGSLHLFLPPLTMDAYLALLPVIEDTLTEFDLRGVVLAGYAPPSDPRLTVVGLASDPGVIEVNVAACGTWAEYHAQLMQLYAAAEKTGLCARKLQFNGRETGTGGGAHIVFGGPPGLLSPFFAHPALLPSMIRYWQRHPGLSYAFTGQYMGPSSQAPRIDESTFEALYELEIACAGAERFGSAGNLPFFDLLFRDLLMDRSGNTHRAEISVDKLWNPSAGNGRLGLVELRAFETHPAGPALSVTGLFVRAVLARLAVDPCRESFVRWGGELHDRFFLPAFVWSDLRAICADLQAHDIPFDPEWLRPLWEWRFPACGEFVLPPIPGRKGRSTPGRVTFRQALEAWPLLGEQSAGAGTSRSVDASFDRLEACVDDAALLDEGTLLVNGLPCAFQPTGDGAAAGGVRFRAFFLLPALHPHVPIHAPLLLEWVDRASLTVAAAARWHVWNPHGQLYPARPLDEAEARRRHADRWEPWPQTIGHARTIPAVEFPPEGRHTLDLRRHT
ncbi:MAG TPA: transglutaminase family protein [Opitutaceae bacterium]|nr:transglutaminase family protein [Opitutaceae bacterium]